MSETLVNELVVIFHERENQATMDQVKLMRTEGPIVLEIAGHVLIILRQLGRLGLPAQVETCHHRERIRLGHFDRPDACSATYI